MTDLKKITCLNEEFHMFSVLNEVSPLKKGILDRHTTSLKDALWLKDIESTASSGILKGFKPLKSSFVADKILENGGTVIGKTIQDEFGFGSFSVNVGTGYEIPLNPVDKKRSAGGSSGGAAVAASLIDNHISIAESTGGSITTPAAFCGVVGVCPTYGRVSRSGLITYASSLDKIGVMSRKIKDSALALSVISGEDEDDETSSPVPVDNYVNSVEEPFSKIDGMKIAVFLPEGINDDIVVKFNEITKLLSENGASVDKIELPFMSKYALSAYYIIAMCEASTHLACLSGLRYGQGAKLDDFNNYNDYFSAVRTENFNKETKRRVLLGTFARMSGYRGKYYMKALKVRQKIINEYKEVFKKFDAIVLPTVPSVAPKFSEIEKMSVSEIYNLDYLSVGPNIAGLPHISVPIHDETNGDLPYGILFVGDHFNESKLFSLGSAVEVLR